MILFPLFVCCECGKLSFDCEDQHCWHTVGFSAVKVLNKQHFARAGEWMLHFRGLHTLQEEDV